MLAELRTVLRRPKFRQWLTLDDAHSFIDAVETIAEVVDDPSTLGRTPICRDPRDEYLVVLAEHTRAMLLVSGDRDRLELERGGLVVRNARDALEALDYVHRWGPHLMPAREHEAQLQTDAEGHDTVFRLTCGFLKVIKDPSAADLQPAIVTPESLSNWLGQLDRVRALVAERGVATRVEYPTPDVAYVKLPPDPGETIRATPYVLLADAVILTLQRRPELPDVTNSGGWRVHAIGDYAPIAPMPNPSADG